MAPAGTCNQSRWMCILCMYLVHFGAKAQELLQDQAPNIATCASDEDIAALECAHNGYWLADDLLKAFASLFSGAGWRPWRKLGQGFANKYIEHDCPKA